MGLIKYIGTNIKGDCTIDYDFKVSMDIINATARKYGIVVVITSSKRSSTNVPGAIVPPAKMGCHLVGHAIDCNLEVGKEYWNSKKMDNPSGVVLQFIEELESKGIRWGGRFAKKDSVHFDSGLNIKNPNKWHELNKQYNG